MKNMDNKIQELQIEAGSKKNIRYSYTAFPLVINYR